MKVNINDNVKIKLTPLGVHHLKYNDPVSYKYNFDQETNILNEQLWVVINIFADAFYIGGEQLFEDNIIEVLSGGNK